jgi:hypothetical protein
MTRCPGPDVNPSFFCGLAGVSACRRPHLNRCAANLPRARHGAGRLAAGALAQRLHFLRRTPDRRAWRAGASRPPFFMPPGVDLELDITAAANPIRRRLRTGRDFLPAPSADALRRGRVHRIAGRGDGIVAHPDTIPRSATGQGSSQHISSSRSLRAPVFSSAQHEAPNDELLRER